MSILVKNGRVLTLGRADREYERADVLIEGNKIAEVGPDLLVDKQVDTVIDARGKLVMPGLVNCHCHSDENFWRGSFDQLPLEPWMMYSIPLFDFGPFPERWIYLRTMLGAIEMLKGGVTTVQDDCIEFARFTVEGFAATMKAYKDSGMRASLARNKCDRPEYEKVPWIREALPKTFLAKMDDVKAPPAAEILEIYREVINEWHGREGDRLRVSLSCSAPQRCTDDYLLMLGELSHECNLPFNMHIAETKVQSVTGPEFYGKSILKHVADLGLLTPRTVIIHSVWMDDDDIRIMGLNQVSVAHNPVSNSKIGSGIMPLRKLVDAGVNVGLGTDGMSTNDGQSMFETMKVALLLQHVANPDYHHWATATEALRMATYGGARACLLHDRIGAIEKGMRADVIIIDLDTPAFVPLNNTKHQIVYCETGSSVTASIIDGKIVMQDRKLAHVDEQSIYAEVRELMPKFREIYEGALRWTKQLAPYYEQVYWRCVHLPLGINRWGG